MDSNKGSIFPVLFIIYEYIGDLIKMQEKDTRMKRVENLLLFDCIVALQDHKSGLQNSVYELHKISREH